MDSSLYVADGLDYDIEVFGGDGVLRAYWNGESTDSWHVFDPSGRWLATVEVPAELRVFELGDDYLIALYQDELEVPFIHVYQLAKSGPLSEN